MPRVEVRPISLPDDAAAFVKCWWPIYEGDAHWVPPLVFERKQFFDPAQNAYFKHADVQCFMAFRNGEAVGTISAQIDRRALEEEPGVGFFGFFEFVDDECIARCLLEAALDWLRERGIHTAKGPYNFSPTHEFGLLVDGFDIDPAAMNPHNRDYYPRIYEAIGLESAMDWYAYWLTAGPIPERFTRIVERMTSRNPNLSVRMVDMKNYDRDVKLFHTIYNDAWQDNWGHVQVSEDEFMDIAKGLKEIIDPRFIWLAFDEDKCIAVSITFPDVNQVVKKMNGSLWPFGWYHWLFGRKQIDALRVFALGVAKDYQRMPIGPLLYLKTWDEGLKAGMKGADASLILDNNHRMRGALEKLGGEIYMTYRVYEADLSTGSDTEEAEHRKQHGADDDTDVAPSPAAGKGEQQA